MKWRNHSDLVVDKYYLIYYKDRKHNPWRGDLQEDRFYIAKFVRRMPMYKFRGRWIYIYIFEYLTGEQKGSPEVEIECFQLSEEEFEKHVLMEYI
jgi:hypothetical protein